MQPVTQKVLGILKRDGHITRVVATHYNIGCVRKAISDLRKASYDIATTKRVDSEGNKYTRWSLVSPEPVSSMKVGDKYKVIDEAKHFFPIGAEVTLYVAKPDREGCYVFLDAKGMKQWLFLSSVVRV